MVLITDERDGGGSSTTPRVKQQQQNPKGASGITQVHPTITEESPSLSDDDSYLGSCESEGDEYEEYGDCSLFPDSKSIASDDSFYPPDDVFADKERTPSPQSPEPLTFFQACCTNNATIVRIMIRQGVGVEEVKETDKNNRTGADGGVLPGLRADMETRDFGRKLTSREWALFRDATNRLAHDTPSSPDPVPYQLCDAYSPEWPQLASLVSKAREPRGCMQRISDTIRNALTFANITEPDDEGVLDHLVTVTTALGSPFVAVACSTVCPSSPPCVGKRRYSVPEILRRQRAKELKTQNPERLDDHRKLFQNSRVTLVPKPPKDRRSSLPPQNKSPTTTNPNLGTVSGSEAVSSVALRRASLLPLGMVRRSSVRPGLSIPKVRITKAPTPTYEPERVRRKSSFKDSGGNFLQLPKWRYKELKEERKRAEEAERRRVEVATRRHLAVGKRK
nr:ankyrin repeat domain-containing protein 33B-like [Salvelinus alpinus]